MLYEEYETEISRSNLSRVVSTLPTPVCLLGGWAVFYTVNPRYRADTGRSYHGSKDIDLGFHIERDATTESLRESVLANAIESLKGTGFRSMGVRLFKEYHRETNLVLTEAKAKKTPSYNIFHLYVDLLVDNAPSGIKKAIGFTPFDEKLLTHVFEGRMSSPIDEFAMPVILPAPPLLLAMKMASLPSRTKDHKKLKDVMDVYALIWYSGMTVKNLRRDVSELVSNDSMTKMLSSIGRSDYEQAADALGVDRAELESVIKNFVLGGGTVKEAKESWALPTNMSYDKLISTVKALHLTRADQKAVKLEKLSKRIGVSARTTKKGLSFLGSVGVVKPLSQDQYALTDTGAAYAKAHMSDDADQISQLTLKIVEQSHLNELADAIKINKNTTREHLYKRIKTFARRPDGKGVGNMHAPDAAGATTVLSLFEDAGLLERATRAPAGKATGKKQRSTNVTSKPHNKPRTRLEYVTSGNNDRQVRSNKEAVVNSETDDLAVLTVRGVGQIQVNDLETLKLAELHMNVLRKRLQNQRQDKAAPADAP